MEEFKSTLSIHISWLCLLIYHSGQKAVPLCRFCELQYTILHRSVFVLFARLSNYSKKCTKYIASGTFSHDSWLRIKCFFSTKESQTHCVFLPSADASRMEKNGSEAIEQYLHGEVEQKIEIMERERCCIQLDTLFKSQNRLWAIAHTHKDAFELYWHVTWFGMPKKNTISWMKIHINTHIFNGIFYCSTPSTQYYFFIPKKNLASCYRTYSEEGASWLKKWVILFRKHDRKR